MVTIKECINHKQAIQTKQPINNTSISSKDIQGTPLKVMGVTILPITDIYFLLLLLFTLIILSYFLNY